MAPCDFRLIELIRQNRHLYDKSHPDFRDLEKKEKTWRAIARAQGSTAEICKRRFRSLRDRFVREKRQNKQQLLEGKTSYPIHLKMMFLWDHLRTHRRFTWKQQQKGSELDERESSGFEADNPDQTQDLEEESERLSEEQQQRLEDMIVEDMEQQNVERSSQNEAESVSNAATTLQEAASRVTRKYRPIKPKPDPRNNPIIVNLASRDSKNFRNQSGSEAESDGREELNELFETSSGVRGRKSMVSSKARQPSQKMEDDDDSSSSQITCNDAFCMMLKDSLDQVTNPLKLSLLRIKILTILHNEVYG